MCRLLAGLIVVVLLAGCTENPVGQTGFGHVSSLYAVRGGEPQPPGRGGS